MRRWLIGPLCALLVLVLLAGAALTIVIRAPLPRYDGVITLSGPSDEITVSRDGRGVPHIYASSDHDLFFAQGYVQAQDRFFQMDMSRHLTAGRLSEMVGEAGKESDIAMRTMGLRRVAEQEGAHIRGVPRLLPGLCRWGQRLPGGQGPLAGGQ
ncbi:penicillin acylase family protein [Actinomyces bowdenii]|uniref:penicillin acylase family protein n=1 Tax=Actinomyces bowdenii TaxID=131109 RepID=UPI00214C0673|nr:penicillin acylase family protein [Actinomyces bowdenii]MCR2053163.1 penicillin acylase family protein [Actinomyces bowdenii]